MSVDGFPLKGFTFGKVVIIGAGHVGAQCAARMLEANDATEIVLVDVDEARAIAQAADLDDLGFGLGSAPIVRAGNWEDIADAHILVITAGRTRKPGETRYDLLDGTIAIMSSICDSIERVGFNGILVSISNPVDAVTDYMRRRLDLPREKCFGTGTALDTSRLARQISRSLGISRREVQAMCLGAHGEEIFVPVTHTYVGTVPILEYLEMHPSAAPQFSLAEIVAENEAKGAHIIAGKGSTEFGISGVVSNIVTTIIEDIRRMMTLTVELEGEFGVEGVPCGVPCILGQAGIELVMDIELSPRERELFDEAISSIRRSVERERAFLPPR